MIADHPITRKRKPSPMTNQHKELTIRFIREFHRVKGLYPTMEEIAKGIGYLSAGTVHKSFVEPLINEGWLKRIHSGARAIAPNKPATDVYCEISDPELKRIAKQQKNLRIMRRL